jgi:hypothetical protein
MVEQKTIKQEHFFFNHFYQVNKILQHKFCVKRMCLSSYSEIVLLVENKILRITRGNITKKNTID